MLKLFRDAARPTPRSLRRRLQEFRGGDRVETVLTRAGEIAYWTRGQGAPVLLLHGNSAGKEVFCKQMDVLAEAGYRAVAVDLPGHGESSDAAAPERDYSIVGYASVMREVIERLDLGGAVMIGWSLGGHVGIEMAGRGYPLSGLALTGTPPCGPGAAEFAETFLPTPAMEVTGKENPSGEELARYVAQLYARLEPTPALFHDLAVRTDGRARRLMIEHAAVGLEGCHQRTVVRGWNKPITVLQGAEEPFFANSALAGLGWRNLWRNEIVEIAGAAHAPHIEQPQAFNTALLAFLHDAHGTKVG